MDTDQQIRSHQWSAMLGESESIFCLRFYMDWIVAIATDTGTLGTVMQVRQDRALEGGITFNVVTIVGSRTEPLLIIAARQLAEKLSGLGYSRPLLLCIGLRKLSVGVTKCLVQEVVQRAGNLSD